MSQHDLDHQPVQKRFQTALQDDVPSHDIDQFRTMFEQSWQRRTVWGRVLRAPVVLVLVGVMILLAGLNAGDSLLFSSQDAQTQSSGLVLMPGQHIVDDPQLIALFPRLDNPTLVSNQSQPDKSGFMVHGYLDEDIQVVWNY